jgi:hypothetical protein
MVTRKRLSVRFRYIVYLVRSEMVSVYCAVWHLFIHSLFIPLRASTNSICLHDFHLLLQNMEQQPSNLQLFVVTFCDEYDIYGEQVR